jgi:hypothetical protein
LAKTPNQAKHTRHTAAAMRACATPPKNRAVEIDGRKFGSAPSGAQGELTAAQKDECQASERWNAI